MTVLFTFENVENVGRSLREHILLHLFFRAVFYYVWICLFLKLMIMSIMIMSISNASHLSSPHHQTGHIVSRDRGGSGCSGVPEKMTKNY